MSEYTMSSKWFYTMYMLKCDRFYTANEEAQMIHVHQNR